jgi:hypothetical protein
MKLDNLLIMAKFKYSILIVLSVLKFFFGGETSMAYEQPKYTVLEKRDNIEIRQYSEFLVAEAEVVGDRDESGTAGFKILAAYIFGKNRGDHNISMTSPVIQSENSPDEKKWIVQFMMPSKYNIESLPKPLDSKVHFKIIPGKKIAAVNYSGRWTESNYQENLSVLKKEIEKAQLKTKGVPLWARYNSPFTPWFLRRNEILIEIE